MRPASTILFIPCFNEDSKIGELLARVAEVRDLLDEVIVVDDGSTDASVERVLSAPLDCTVLRHRSRRGLGEGFRTAYRHSLARGHEIFSVMAGNGKDDPGQLDRVVGPVQRGDADYVQGSRFHAAGGESVRLPWQRGLAIHAMSRATSLVVGRRLTDCSNGFRAYRTALLEDRRIDWCAPWLGSSYQVEIYLLIAAIRCGYRVIEVPVSKTYPGRGTRYSKAVLTDWFRLVKPLIWYGLRGESLAPPERVAPGRAGAEGIEVVRPPIQGSTR